MIIVRHHRTHFCANRPLNGGHMTDAKNLSVRSRFMGLPASLPRILQSQKKCESLTRTRLP